MLSSLSDVYELALAAGVKPLSSVIPSAAGENAFTAAAGVKELTTTGN